MRSENILNGLKPECFISYYDDVLPCFKVAYCQKSDYRNVEAIILLRLHWRHVNFKLREAYNYPTIATDLRAVYDFHMHIFRFSKSLSCGKL